MIHVEQFSKSFETHDAVRDLSFHVNPGEILGLLGPNGAGKTTTLRGIAGILRPTAGRILINGHDIVKDSAVAKRELAWVPDSPNLYDLLTVREHLEFISMAYRLPTNDEAREWLEKFELYDKRDALAATLSRGMKQKVAICCAFVHHPKAILLDEPLTGLDPRGIRVMRDAIRVQAETGAAIVVSSHLLQLLEQLCDRVLILKNGEKVALGTLDEMRDSQALRHDASLEDVFFQMTEGGAEGESDDAAGASDGAKP